MIKTANHKEAARVGDDGNMDARDPVRLARVSMRRYIVASVQSRDRPRRVLAAGKEQHQISDDAIRLGLQVAGVDYDEWPLRVLVLRLRRQRTVNPLDKAD